MRISLLAGSIVGAAALTACADVPTVCSTYGQAGLSIEARDAATHQLVAADIGGSARSGDYVETLVGNGPFLHGLHERPGRYMVAIEALGYAPWDSTGVRVRVGNDCHVETTTITVLLAPTGPAAAT